MIFRRLSNRAALDHLAPVMAYGSRSPAAYHSDKGHLILITQDQMQKAGRIIGGDDGFRWHMSISHPSRYPTWDEMKTARYRLLPDDCYMVQILPPKAQYLNAHDRCFHLTEMRDGDRVPADDPA